VAPYTNGKLYYNFAESPADATRFYRDDSYARLRRLRAEVDPDGVIVANHPIPGAPGAR
jgi:FAD/FMN-containing dehydrogenase